ncbi:MAG: hypothetical protein H0X40_01555 [Chthoniobacterales bacterium]|nr:hypothetical protein [Chthoniobacterales bacterium]
MRGSPLFRTAVILLALLLLILPLRSLTSARSKAALAPLLPVAPVAAVQLTLTSTSVPFRFQVSHLGKTIWGGESSASSRSKSLTIPFPAEGIDLVVQASWPEKKDTAIRVDLTRGENPPTTRTLWGTEQVNDVVTFAPSP